MTGKKKEIALEPKSGSANKTKEKSLDAINECKKEMQIGRQEDNASERPGNSAANPDKEEGEQKSIELNNKEKSPSSKTIKKKKKAEKERRQSTICEICAAEQWWEKAASNNTVIQQHQDNIMKQSGKMTNEQKARFEQLLQTQKQVLNDEILESLKEKFGEKLPPQHCDFTMYRLFEFFEFQRTCASKGSAFCNDFDDFWLLVIKARLFHLFRTKGPEAYNRVVHRIREIVKKYTSEEAVGDAMPRPVEDKVAKPVLLDVNKNGPVVTPAAKNLTTTTKGGGQNREKSAG